MFMCTEDFVEAASPPPAMISRRTPRAQTTGGKRRIGTGGKKRIGTGGKRLGEIFERDTSDAILENLRNEGRRSPVLRGEREFCMYACVFALYVCFMYVCVCVCMFVCVATFMDSCGRRTVFVCVSMHAFAQSKV